MRLVRFMPATQELRKAFDQRESIPQAPVPAIRAVMPSDRELDHISLYRIEDSESPLFILAAFSLLVKGSHILSHVDEDVIRQSGVTISDTKGNTDSPLVNDRHVDCRFTDGAQALAVAECFYRGTFEVYEAVEVRQQIIHDFCAGRLDLLSAAKKPEANRASTLCDLIAKGNIVIGCPPIQAC